MSDIIVADSRERQLDAQSASLVEHIRSSLIIQSEMFRRLLDTTPKPSLLLAELLEDTGNRYLDLSDLVSEAYSDNLKVEKERVSLTIGGIAHGEKHLVLEPGISRTK